jgi:hypothetical protein
MVYRFALRGANVVTANAHRGLPPAAEPACLPAGNPLTRAAGRNGYRPCFAGAREEARTGGGRHPDTADQNHRGARHRPSDPRGTVRHRHPGALRARRNRPCDGRSDLAGWRLLNLCTVPLRTVDRKRKPDSPHPFTAADRAAGDRHDLSIRRAEFSLDPDARHTDLGSDLPRAGHPRQPRHRPPRSGRSRLRPPSDPPRPSRDTGTVPGPG